MTDRKYRLLTVLFFSYLIFGILPHAGADQPYGEIPDCDSEGTPFSKSGGHSNLGHRSDVCHPPIPASLMDWTDEQTALVEEARAGNPLDFEFPPYPTEFQPAQTNKLGAGNGDTTVLNCSDDEGEGEGGGGQPVCQEDPCPFEEVCKKLQLKVICQREVRNRWTGAHVGWNDPAPLPLQNPLWSEEIRFPVPACMPEWVKEMWIDQVVTAACQALLQEVTDPNDGAYRDLVQNYENQAGLQNCELACVGEECS